MSVSRAFGVCFTGICLLHFQSAATAEQRLQIRPEQVVLERPEATQQLLVHTQNAAGRVIDATRTANIIVRPSELAKVDDRGLLRPLSNGEGHIQISVGEVSQTIPIRVQKLDAPTPISFRNEVMPILTKAGCSSGGCHGKAEGQNGFKLSIFGFDPVADFEAIVQESRGRRIRVGQPAASLLFRKASARIPHGGGQKIEPHSHRDQLLLRWISEGAKFDSPEDGVKVVGLEIYPTEQVLYAGEAQQIQVLAIDSSGARHCVTHEAEYESNAAAIADVDASGLIQAGDIPGEAAMLVRHLGHVSTCRISLPQPGITFPRPDESNFIDGLAWDKLQRLGIAPSPLADDATFLRRVFLDVIGTLPNSEEARKFLEDASPHKRSRLVDHLLERDEYVDYWTMKWLDVLRADQLIVSPQGTVAMQRWLKSSFAGNKPFDQMATELLTVQGNTSAQGPGAFYKILDEPEQAARSVSQLLLGVRIECAQCHHHPSERWSQADYVGLAGFFTGMKLKKLPNGEQAVVSFGGKDLPHPRTGELVAARALGAESADFSGVADRRIVLAHWLTADSNPFFARAIANRMWAHYFGRGLVEPIDDLRDTNPATNPPLMNALTDHMREVKFDLKAFTRTLLTSRLYQLSHDTVPSNATDQQNFSHFMQKPMPAEVLLDAISAATDVPEEFNGWPVGYRAIQIWDNRMPSYFFRIFGRPVRATVCECERSSEPSIAQALHLLNAPEIQARIAHRRGRARQLAESNLSSTQIIEELYLSTLSRPPLPAEQQLMQQAFDIADRSAAAEDILWTLLNSKEFVFNH